MTDKKVSEEGFVSNVNIDSFDYPIGSVRGKFHFKSGKVFDPYLRVNALGRHEPTVRFFCEGESPGVPVSVLLNVGTRNAELKFIHPNKTFDSEVLSVAVRGQLVASALAALERHYVVLGRYKVQWVDYSILPQGWPDRNAFVDELRFLFPTLDATLADGNSYRDPVLVSSSAKGPGGWPLFDASYDCGINPAFSKWIESRGFTVCIPEDGGAPEIFHSKFLDNAHDEEEEETGWCLLPILEGQG